MALQSLTYNGNKPGCWLFLAILSLSVCTFSGMVADTFSGHRQSTRTEVVVTKGDQVDGFVSIDQLWSDLFVDHSLHSSNSWVRELSSLHNLLTRVQLEANTEQLLVTERLFPFLLVENRPVYSDHNISSAAAG